MTMKKEKKKKKETRTKRKEKKKKKKKGKKGECDMNGKISKSYTSRLIFSTTKTRRSFTNR